jgi:hypothetical protein
LRLTVVLGRPSAREAAMKFTEQEIGDVVQAQRARGGDKAAVFHHFGEHQQLVEICLRHQPTPAKKTR